MFSNKTLNICIGEYLHWTHLLKTGFEIDMGISGINSVFRVLGCSGRRLNDSFIT